MPSSSLLTDALGQTHIACQQTGGAPRIVSLVPSITELVCDLGLASYLVGRTGFCIHPATTVKDIPKIGGTKDVNIEKIRRLAPTHLIVNIDENEKPTVDRLAGLIPHVIVTHPTAARDNLSLYRLLGGIFGVTSAAEKLCAEFEHAYRELPAQIKPERVLYCIWQDPWMTVAQDTYIANMLSLIGWQQTAITTSQQRYPSFNWNEELLYGIDRVLLSSEPYRFTETHVDALEKQLGKPVQLVDGEMLSWYGSRAIQGLRYLATLSQT
ncbi:helical backbone metal receptor [Undibacterium sp. Jales W-56]|uniref:helical backbone metal receptor n=1 Tax=Undibacterium sp. Jales W-56 TaxID=2897325 RepID=UPI0021D3E472|nr:helical backbone metal receptor [Undibacterium sp. Jales W-56]MCU6434816.1 helical backbone metal receptor [Undibacterium sp. Jales W-56]